MDNYELSADLEFEDPETGDSARASIDGLSGNGVVGGLFLGYQIASPRLFGAVEGFISQSDADISQSDADISMSAGINDGVNDYNARIKAAAKESWGFAARLGTRVNTMTGVYARLGWVNTELKVSGSCRIPDYCEGSGSAEETQDAVQCGAGKL